MKSQTARRPDQQRSTRSAKSRKYVRQTAHVEARRDGKPLIFGWGGHLSRSEKMRIQNRAVWSLTILILVAIVAVLVGFWININVIIPNKAITTVNNQPIPQSDFRKMVALDAQLELNKIYGPHGLNAQRDALRKQVSNQQAIIDATNKQGADLTKQLQALPAKSAQRATLQQQIDAAKAKVNSAATAQTQANTQYQTMINTTIPNEMQLYVQSQVANDSVGWLQDDVFIRNWLAKQSSSVQAQIQPSTDAINSAIKSFTANIPSSSSYSKFLNDNHVSDADIHAMMALKLRRDNMQSYLSSQITSPAYQVQVRAMTISAQKDANTILAQLQKGGNFATTAKAKSVDNDTNTKGGEIGWLARGQFAKEHAANTSGLVDNWIFDPARKANELSPVLYENGTYHIVQIEGIDPSRAIPAATLQELKTNALTAWLLSQKALPGVQVTTPDQTMLLDPTNMPAGLPSSPPAQPTPTVPGGGLPSGAGGLPSGAGGLPTGQ